MQKILLTQKQYALVDDEDYDWLMQNIWFCHKANITHYAQRNSNKSGKRISIRMHRVIMNAPDGMEVDHRDGNGLNNQKHNLRICTRAQNAMNVGAINKTSKYKGVSLRKTSNKWKAAIRINNKPVHLGYFYIEDDAARAYNEAALVHHGEFARLNVIPD